MNGKSKCKILKEIRNKIARENDIPYITGECKFQGNCSGTCPKCEAEVRYLEQELLKRRSAGKAVAVAGIAAAMLVTATGCDLFRQETKTPDEAAPTTEPATEHLFIEGSIAYAPETEEVLDGDVPYPETEELLDGDVPYSETLMGEPVYTEPTEELLLTGDVAWPIP